MQSTILVVEDEPPIRQMLRFSLEKEGYAVIEAADAAAARVALSDVRPELVLLDWMLPGVSGIEIAREMKRDERSRHIPIIMLTARDAEDDLVHGLTAGADDYLPKPFSRRELIARIKVQLRRLQNDQPQRLQIGALQVDTGSARVSVEGNVVHVAPTEYRLLEFLMRNPDRVYNRTQLLDQVWGANVYVEERTVDVHIRRLRKALEPVSCEGLIQTVRGMGYRCSAVG